jgi:hypothetical protein
MKVKGALAAVGTVAVTALLTLGTGVAASASSNSTHNSKQKLAATAHFLKVNYRTPVGPHSIVGQSAAGRSAVTRVDGNNGSINGYSYVTITPHNGSSGGFNMGFHSSYSSGCDFWSCWRNINSGNSYANWLGSSPWNADNMGLTDNIWVGGVAISISVGIPPSAGIGVSVNNNTVSMSSSYGPTWQIAHNYQNVDFSTHVAIWGPYQSGSSSASFTWQTFYNNIN